MEQELAQELEKYEQNKDLVYAAKRYALRAGYWRALSLFVGFLGILAVFWTLGIQEKLTAEFYLEFFGYPMLYWQVGVQLCFLAFQLISLLIHRFSHADLKPWSYFGALVEFLFLLVGMGLMAQTLDPVLVLSGPWFLYFLVLLFSLIIYQDRNLCFTISVVMAIVYLGAAGILLQFSNEGFMSDPVHHLFRAGLLVFSGFISGVVIRESRRALLSSILPEIKRGQEVLEGRELELEVQSRLVRSQGRFVFPEGALDLMGRNSAAELRTGDHFKGKMTVLNANICSFTSYAEVHKPIEIFEFLSVFLEQMEPEIRDAGGMITHHIGDGVVALFNRSPEDALKAAIEMQRALDKLNESRTKKRDLPFSMGIGIQLGNLVYGTLNLEGRMEGTLVGSPAHQAEKIQELTRKYGLSILITKDVLDAIPNHLKYHYRFVDRIKLKGAGDRIDLYEVFDADTGDLFRQKNLTRTRIQEAGIALWEGEYGKAFELYRELRTEAPGDPLLAFMEDRCMKVLKK